MFLDNMSTDQEPADYKTVARSLSRKIRKERMRNKHLVWLLNHRNQHLRRIYKKHKKLLKVVDENGIPRMRT